MDADESVLEDALHVVLLPLLVCPQLDLLDMHALLQTEEHVCFLARKARFWLYLPHL